VGAPLPVHGVVVDELEVGFVHQRGGVEGDAGAVAAQLQVRRAVQFVVDQRQQVVERLAVVIAQAPQQVRNLSRGRSRHRGKR
jgi:hypothetical protein